MEWTDGKNKTFSDILRKNKPKNIAYTGHSICCTNPSRRTQAYCQVVMPSVRRFRSNPRARATLSCRAGGEGP